MGEKKLKQNKMKTRNNKKILKMFPNLKHMSFHIQKSQQVPRSMHEKCSKVKPQGKEKILKYLRMREREKDKQHCIKD